jgi:hypothetical protein
MLNSVKNDTNVQRFCFSTCMPTLELHGKNLYEIKYQEVTQILDGKHFLQHLVLVGGKDGFWLILVPFYQHLPVLH